MDTLKPIIKLIKKGNMKLPKDIAVTNMGSATKCISKKLGLCQIACKGKKCYAENAEVQYYKVVKPYRDRQEKAWKKYSADLYYKAILRINDRSRKTKLKYLRFNESGDIFDYNDLVKLNTIAEKLKKHGIRVYIYTARRIFFGQWSENITFNGSGFMLDNNYEADNPAYFKDTDFVCKGDCKKCHACKHSNGITIKTKLR